MVTLQAAQQEQKMVETSYEPVNIGTPVGDLVTWVEVGQSKLAYQLYDNGSLWQISAPRFSPFDPSIFAEIPKGIWLTVHDPEVFDEPDDRLYLSVWVPMRRFNG